MSDMAEPRHRPFKATPEIVVTSAWSLAGRMAERELAPDGGFAALGVAGTAILHDEIVAAGLPFLAALVASSETFRRGSERPSLSDEESSPWRDRFLGVEASCRAAVSMDVERMLGEDADAEPLIAAARARGLTTLVDLLAERLHGAELDGPTLA